MNDRNRSHKKKREHQLRNQGDERMGDEEKEPRHSPTRGLLLYALSLPAMAPGRSPRGEGPWGMGECDARGPQLLRCGVLCSYGRLLRDHTSTLRPIEAHQVFEGLVFSAGLFLFPTQPFFESRIVSNRTRGPPSTIRRAQVLLERGIDMRTRSGCPSAPLLAHPGNPSAVG